MDPQLPSDESDRQGSVQTESGAHPPACSGKPGRKQKIAPPLPPAAKLLIQTCRHFLPDWSAEIDRLPDPRRPEQRVYSTAHLVWLGISMFLMHLDSRRQLREERCTEAFRLNLEKLSEQSGVATVADTDTRGYFAKHMPPEAMEGLLASMTRRLIRKALDAFRLYGTFTVAIDGSEVGTFDHEPWPGCPHRTLNCSPHHLRHIPYSPTHPGAAHPLALGRDAIDPGLPLSIRPPPDSSELRHLPPS